jgi:Fibronectin type III-like domain
VNKSIRLLLALPVALFLLASFYRPVLSPIPVMQRIAYKDPQLSIEPKHFAFHCVGSVITPLLALKGFGRVTLDPGEACVIHFSIGPDALALWNRETKRVVEPGEFKLMIGSSPADIRLTNSLFVKP